MTTFVALRTSAHRGSHVRKWPLLFRFTRSLFGRVHARPLTQSWPRCAGRRRYDHRCCPHLCRRHWCAWPCSDPRIRDRARRGRPSGSCGRVHMGQPGKAQRVPLWLCIRLRRAIPRPHLCLSALQLLVAFACDSFLGAPVLTSSAVQARTVNQSPLGPLPPFCEEAVRRIERLPGVGKVSSCRSFRVHRCLGSGPASDWTCVPTWAMQKVAFEILGRCLLPPENCAKLSGWYSSTSASTVHDPRAAWVSEQRPVLAHAFGK